MRIGGLMPLYLNQNKKIILNIWMVVNIIGFLVIISMALYGLMKDKLPFSLNKVFNIFCLFFMGAAPLLQYLSGKFPFPWMQNSGDEYSFAICNTIIILGMILYHFIYQNRLGKDHLTNSGQGVMEINLNRFKLPGMMFFFIVILIQYFISGNLWSRSAAEDNIVIQNSSLNLLADKTLKGIVLYYCLAAIHLYKAGKINSAYLLAIISLAIITNFPAAVPRYWIATLYLGIILSWYKAFFVQRKQLFNLLITGGLLIIFPLFNLTRIKKHVAEQIFSSWKNGRKGFYALFENAFCGQDFDAYSSFRNTIIHVQQHGLFFGKQLSTTCLFFIPRTLWPGKSIGSGAIVNLPKPGSDFTNYSSPLIAEGYIDFGIIGSLAFIALFAFLSSRYDRHYWKSGQKNLSTLLYPSFIGMSFFMLRGDLLSSFAYTAGIAFSAWLCHQCLSSKSAETTAC